MIPHGPSRYIFTQLVVIDDAGHMVHEEKPDAVNRAIASFLDAIRW
jgi:pimeloyl-ACP methyl ester carboxylesterase